MQKLKGPFHDYNIFAIKTARRSFAQIRFVRTNFLAKVNLSENREGRDKTAAKVLWKKM